MKALFIIIVLTGIIACSKPKPNPKIVAFYNDPAISDQTGNPRDSSTLYFPEKVFYDTVKYITYKNGSFTLYPDINLTDFLKQQNLNRDSLTIKDSVNIERSTWHAKFWSFALFKMKEPVLYNYYLGKETYRLIIDRSLSKFFIIRIENGFDGISITTKGLNRRIEYPLLKFPTMTFSSNPSPDDLKKQKQYNDSMAQVHNNTNYFADDITYKKLTPNQWKKLQEQLATTKFWDSFPKTCGSCSQIDGSRWVLEGQNASGYQIHEEMSPFSYKGNKAYADLFKFIVDLSGLDSKKNKLY